MSNWRPVLLALVQGDRKVDAVKLWATVRGIDLETAMHEMDDVYAHRVPFPDGSEHPDVSNHVLSLYRERLNVCGA